VAFGAQLLVDSPVAVHTAKKDILDGLLVDRLVGGKGAVVLSHLAYVGVEALATERLLEVGE